MEIDQLPNGQGAQNGYFSSYEDLEVHSLMILDHPRTEAYRKAILDNKELFKDKIVMDIGCGTGILSLFCAQAGAKKVYAIEASNVAEIAKEIVKENNLEDVIEVIHSRVEDVVLPDNTKVDAIVAEWMGFFLLHEGMLDSVLVARDKFLKDGGLMFPESATIYIAPCSVPSVYETWTDLYGVSLSTFAKHLRASKLNKPEIMTVKPDELIGEEVAVCWIDLKEDKVSDLNSFSIQHVASASKSGIYQGLCIWFDCMFPEVPNREEPRLILSTSPYSPSTHWKQTVIVLPQEQQVDESEPIAFKMEMNRDNSNCRRYNLQVTMLDPDTIEHPLPCNCHMTKCILIKTFMTQHPEQSPNNAEIEYSSPVLEEENIADEEE